MATDTTVSERMPDTHTHQVLSWLRCRVGPGQFPDEYAVWGETFNGRPFSLFAPHNYVRPPLEAERGEGLLRVAIGERKGNLVLLRLPQPSFEGGSYYITVTADQLVD